MSTNPSSTALITAIKSGNINNLIESLNVLSAEQPESNKYDILKTHCTDLNDYFPENSNPINEDLQKWLNDILNDNLLPKANAYTLNHLVNNDHIDIEITKVVISLIEFPLQGSPVVNYTVMLQGTDLNTWSAINDNMNQE